MVIRLDFWLYFFLLKIVKILSEIWDFIILPVTLVNDILWQYDDMFWRFKAIIYQKFENEWSKNIVITLHFALAKVANSFEEVFWHPKVTNSKNILQKLFHPRYISPIHFYIPPTMFSFLWRQCAVIYFSLSKFISFFNVRLYKTCPCLILMILSQFYQDFIQTKFGINLNKIVLILILSSLHLV